MPVARFALGVLCVAAVLALLFVAPVTAWPGAGGPADCAAADGGVQVKLVLDFGILAGEQGAPSAVSSRCVSTSSGASGLKVLEAGGHTYRMNNSNLLCAIDGYPSGAECGDRTTEGYRYWAYFAGGSTWTYSGIGPTGRHVSEGAVEGWHFVSGKGNPTDPPPNASPQSCAPTPTAPPPTAAPTTAPPGPAPTASPIPKSATTGGGSNGAGQQPVPTSPGAVTTPPIGGGNPATTVPAAAPGAAGPEGASAPGTGPADSPGTPGGTDLAVAAPGSVVPPQDGRAVPVRETARDPGSGPVEVAATPAAARASSGGAPIAAVLGVIAVLALGGFAVFRMRARPEDS